MPPPYHRTSRARSRIWVAPSPPSIPTRCQTAPDGWATHRPRRLAFRWARRRPFANSLLESLSTVAIAPSKRVTGDKIDCKCDHAGCDGIRGDGPMGACSQSESWVSLERSTYQETAGTTMPAARERGIWRSQTAPLVLRLAGAIVGGLVIATRRIAPQCEHNNGDTGDDVNSRRSHPS